MFGGMSVIIFLKITVPFDKNLQKVIISIPNFICGHIIIKNYYNEPKMVSESENPLDVVQKKYFVV